LPNILGDILASSAKLISYQYAMSPQGGFSQDLQPKPGNNPAKADFIALPGTNFNVIVYNPANFWQYTLSDMLGTLPHEYIHLGDPGVLDTAIQQTLGLTQNTNDTSNISVKLTDDCFGGGAVPLQQ
jgi:hypothetical protein